MWNKSVTAKFLLTSKKWKYMRSQWPLPSTFVLQNKISPGVLKTSHSQHEVDEYEVTVSFDLWSTQPIQFIINSNSTVWTKLWGNSFKVFFRYHDQRSGLQKLNECKVNGTLTFDLWPLKSKKIHHWDQVDICTKCVCRIHKNCAWTT